MNRTDVAKRMHDQNPNLDFSIKIQRFDESKSSFDVFLSFFFLCVICFFFAPFVGTHFLLISTRFVGTKHRSSHKRASEHTNRMQMHTRTPLLVREVRKGRVHIRIYKSMVAVTTQQMR